MTLHRLLIVVILLCVAAAARADYLPKAEPVADNVLGFNLIESRLSIAVPPSRA